MNLFVLTREFDENSACAALSLIESHFPTTSIKYRLEGTMSDAGEAPHVEIHEVEKPAPWLARRATTMDSSLLCNGSNDAYVGITTRLLDAYCFTEGESVFQTVIDFPERSEYLHRVTGLLCALGATMRACYATTTPSSAAVAIVQGAGNVTPWASMKSTGRGISAYVPRRADWASCWSHETCRRLGFSMANHGGLFAQATELPDYGVFVQLTDEPLDLELSPHRIKLEALYKALPEIAHSHRD